MSLLLLDIPEIIETSRLKLCIPQAGWGTAVHEAIKDGYDDYIKWLSWPSSCPSVEEVEKETRRHHAEFILREGIRYLIIDKKTEKVMGRCAFPSFQVKWNVPQFGISYFIRKTQRKKGYATEAAHAMALLAFRKLGAKKVEIYCDIENTASIQVALNLGFQFEYQQKGGWPRLNGELATLNTYSCFDEHQIPDKKITFL